MSLNGIIVIKVLYAKIKSSNFPRKKERERKEARKEGREKEKLDSLSESLLSCIS